MPTIFRAVGPLAAVIALLPSAALAATFTVNNTGDAPDAAIGNRVCATSTGVCTLRAAIQEANATLTADVIAFAIATGPQTITLGGSLPPITSPVLLDGTTQPGFAGAPLVEISGSLFIDNGITITGGSSGMRGLVVNGFGGNAVLLNGTGGNVLEGNYIGTDLTGTQVRRNLGAGIRIESPSNRIGGLTPDKRNIISGNGGLGIEGGVLIIGSQAVANVVQGNYIGVDVTGMIPLGNLGRGVVVHFASYNMIGGDQPGAGNLISGNRASGIRIMSSSTNNVVWRNFIGVNAQGQTRRGEYPDPLALSNARGVQIRGDNNYVLENVIAGNTEDGVLFYDGTGRDLIPLGNPANNLVRGNYIYDNGFSGIGVFVGINNRFQKNAVFGNAHIGINLENKEFGGVTANDPLDADEGTNGGQNYPELSSAVVAGSQTTVTGVLNSAPSKTYTVELSANPTCSVFLYGEGRYPIVEASVTTDAAGVGAINVVLPYAIPRGWTMSATATDPTGSTSEYARCIVVR